MAADLVALDDFAGHGFGVALQRLGIDEAGVELMPDVRETRAANGMRTIYEDVWDGVLGRAETPDHHLYLAGPPCPTFSAAGKGDGRRAMPQILEAIARGDWKQPERLFELTHRTDPRTALVLVPLARIHRHRPIYVVLEQVPPVLPVWASIAAPLKQMGYSVWTGHLHSEQFGVASTRKRAVLIARRDGRIAAPPTPTHSRFYPRDPSRLDHGVKRWVTQHEAIGWGMTSRPYLSLAAGTASGGQDPAMVGGSGARATLQRELDAGRWINRSNYGTSGNAAIRGERRADQPAATITGKVNRNRIVTAKGETSLSVLEAAMLQSYPESFEWPCGRTSSYQQIGNSVPPLLAEAIIRELVL